MRGAFFDVVVSSKAEAELPHTKVDCAGGGGVLRCDLAMTPEIEGGENE